MTINYLRTLVKEQHPELLGVKFLGSSTYVLETKPIGDKHPLQIKTGSVKEIFAFLEGYAFYKANQYRLTKDV